MVDIFFFLYKGKSFVRIKRPIIPLTQILFMDYTNFSGNY